MKAEANLHVNAYPTGWNAIWYGWCFGFGFCSGACALAAIGLAIVRLIGGEA